MKGIIRKVMRMEKKEDFLKNKFVFGLVVKASLEDINMIKKYVVGKTDSDIVYQRISTNRLWIKEED